MRRLVVPAALAVLALSFVSVTARPAARPTGLGPVGVLGDRAAPGGTPGAVTGGGDAAGTVLVGGRPCHFLRIAPGRDLDPEFVVPAPSLGVLPAVAVADRPGPAPGVVVVPSAGTPGPGPGPGAVARDGESCHAPPPVVPLGGR